MGRKKSALSACPCEWSDITRLYSRVARCSGDIWEISGGETGDEGGGPARPGRGPRGGAGAAALRERRAAPQYQLDLSGVVGARGAGEVRGVFGRGAMALRGGLEYLTVPC